MNLCHFYSNIFLVICLCITHSNIFQSGCYCQEINELLPNASVIIDQMKIIKEKAAASPQITDWNEKCKKIVGGRKWRVIRNSRSRILECVSKYVDYAEFQTEVEDSKQNGDLDLVFKKYCGKREQVMECIEETVNEVKPCLDDQQLLDVNITLDALNAGIDFTCYENGDRIALFMAEDGIQCLSNTSETIKQCIEDKVPEFKEAMNNTQSIQINKLLINKENCRKLSYAHKCIVTATTTCDDPTPSNMLDSLIKQALKVTPCTDIESYVPNTPNASNAFYVQFWVLVPHMLTVILSGLTAAHILL